MIIYVDKFKSELGDIKVSTTLNGKEYSLLGKTKDKDSLIESVQRTSDLLNKHGEKCLEEDGYPKPEYASN